MSAISSKLYSIRRHRLSFHSGEANPVLAYKQVLHWNTIILYYITMWTKLQAVR